MKTLILLFTIGLSLSTIVSANECDIAKLKLHNAESFIGSAEERELNESINQYLDKISAAQKKIEILEPLIHSSKSNDNISFYTRVLKKINNTIISYESIIDSEMTMIEMKMKVIESETRWVKYYCE